MMSSSRGGARAASFAEKISSPQGAGQSPGLPAVLQKGRFMKTIVICAAILVALPTFAFDVKGISPGADIVSIDRKGCRPVANADSGLPGYECDTTYAGERATMRLIVPDKRVIAVVVRVENGDFLPTLKALEEKYGSAHQPNRFIESYVWRSGPSYLQIEQSRSGQGYSVTTMDFDLYNAITKQKTEKVKGDL